LIVISSGGVVEQLRTFGGESVSAGTALPGWREFLKAYREVLAATDFFTVEVWTGRGLVPYHLCLLVPPLTTPPPATAVFVLKELLKVLLRSIETLTFRRMLNQRVRNLLTLSHQHGVKTPYHPMTSTSKITFMKDSAVANIEVLGSAQIRHDTPTAQRILNDKRERS
jgi:hypothetical protein